MDENRERAGLALGADGTWRCAWAGDDPLYRRYHDEEWGRPSADDDRLFEKLCLEGFQSGLSWITILRKREAFRELFHGFSIAEVAAMGEADIERLVLDPRIIRHRGKIASAINNAKRALEVQAEHGSLAAFLWRFEPKADERPESVTLEWARANTTSQASAALSKALKKRGFSFVGPTTIYAFMQAMGFVNDHFDGCACRDSCETSRRAFVRPPS
ncbi:DNA-3-methyladenine glycosylase I [Mangrovicella endophytica]|uniref:DNA-3-methyladenine glycosylase I n=1 Tax=Mangrovicella endophytica TaxID=2066697 RepID=UPI000C9DAF40|nr:DNA-3-methyladenine glycosylase I [Mangrovicella endophytica]